MSDASSDRCYFDVWVELSGPTPARRVSAIGADLPLLERLMNAEDCPLRPLPRVSRWV